MNLSFRIAVMLLGNLLISGCVFFGLQEDIKLLNAATTIKGTIKTTSPLNKPIFVALYHLEGPNQYHLETYSVMYGPGEFEFLRGEGDYYLIAFEDANEDLTFQRNEYIGWHGAPTLLEARPGVNFTDLAIELRSPDLAQRVLPELFANIVSNTPLREEDSRLGKIVDRDDPHFTQEVGALGMWEPVKFVQQGYNGIFFLESYDPEKIPVLLIHGLSGAGHDWRHIIDRLDHKRFQPWILQYPSGLRLGYLSKFLNQAVNKMQVEYKFKTLFVVAHSMGGLVARGFINRNVAQNDQGIIKLFVSISTPWQGHLGARSGVKNAPVVVPSWYDMVPGSPYIESLFEQPLPGHVPHYLLFSYRGNRGLINEANSDGTVTLQSQLSLVAQDHAVKVFGFDEDHISILQSKAVLNKLNEIMSAIQNAR